MFGCCKVRKYHKDLFLCVFPSEKIYTCLKRLYMIRFEFRTYFPALLSLFYEVVSNATEIVLIEKATQRTMLQSLRVLGRVRCTQPYPASSEVVSTIWTHDLQVAVVKSCCCTKALPHWNYFYWSITYLFCDWKTDMKWIRFFILISCRRCSCPI